MCPMKKAIFKAFMFYSEEPEFPASMLFGLCLGLALWGRREDFIGVRQSGALLAVQWAESLHQRLQLVLLQLKVQLNTVTQKRAEFTFSTDRKNRNINLAVVKVFHWAAITFMTQFLTYFFMLAIH